MPQNVILTVIWHFWSRAWKINVDNKEFDELCQEIFDLTGCNFWEDFATFAKVNAILHFISIGISTLLKIITFCKNHNTCPFLRFPTVVFGNRSKTVESAWDHSSEELKQTLCIVIVINLLIGLPPLKIAHIFLVMSGLQLQVKKDNYIF